MGVFDRVRRPKKGSIKGVTLGGKMGVFDRVRRSMKGSIKGETLGVQKGGIR